MSDSIFADTMADLTYVQVEEAARRGVPVLVPLGVIEEHGPHLPLGTDIYGAYVLSRLVKQGLAEHGVECLLSPPMYWGINQVTSAFVGSFRVRPATARALLDDVLDSLQEQGFHELFLINHHGDQLHNEVIVAAVRAQQEKGNSGVRFVETDHMMRRLGVEHDDPAFACYPTPTELSILRRPETLGVHAMDEETALIARWFPELVDYDALWPLEPTDLTAEDLQAWRKGGEDARRVTPLGYFGDPHPHDPMLWRRYTWLASSMAQTIVKTLAQAN